MSLSLLQGATSWQLYLVDLSSHMWRQFSVWSMFVAQSTFSFLSRRPNNETNCIPGQKWPFLSEFPMYKQVFPMLHKHVTQARILPFANLHCGMYGSYSHRCHHFTYFIYFTYYSQVAHKFTTWRDIDFFWLFGYQDRSHRFYMNFPYTNRSSPCYTNMSHRQEFSLLPFCTVVYMVVVHTGVIILHILDISHITARLYGLGKKIRICWWCISTVIDKQTRQFLVTQFWNPAQTSGYLKNCQNV